MSAIGGPNIVEDGLVLALDAANPKGISPAANEVYNGASQFVKNLVNKSDSISANNGVKLGNINYYTAFAIDYPEGNFGGAAANRQGITPGFNVTSGAKTYDASRALHLWVWNNSTNTWLPSTYFNGLRLSGHCYDSYVGTAEVNKWVDDYTNIKNTFDDITVIAAGSHRDSYHTTAQYDILRDLGAPSNVNSIIGFSSPEWILVGKPGLGASNAYVWSFQNYTTNPTQVAHAVFPLPIDKVNPENYFEFDGVDDAISIADKAELKLAGDKTLAIWVYLGANNSGCGIAGKSNSTLKGLALGYGWNGNGFMALAWNSSNTPFLAKDLSRDVQKWVYLVATQIGNTRYVYAVDSIGIRSSTSTSGSHTWNNNIPLTVGNANNGSNQVPSGTRIANLQVYNRGLTAQEVLQNYNATKSRFNL
jgi:hypothetical protein